MAQSSYRSVTHYQGHQIVATRAGGLARVEADGPVQIDLGLAPSQSQIQAVAVHMEHLWLGTDGGLLHLVPTSCGYRVEPVLSYPVSALAKKRGSLEVITRGHGTYHVGARGMVHRVDTVPGAANRI